MAIATRKQLTKVGFTDRRKNKILFEVAGGATPTLQQFYDAGFTPRQARTLKNNAGALTMKKLLHGGFNRFEAKLILQT